MYQLNVFISVGFVRIVGFQVLLCNAEMVATGGLEDG
jgi:hypothetical protein